MLDLVLAALVVLERAQQVRDAHASLHLAAPRRAAHIQPLPVRDRELQHRGLASRSEHSPAPDVEQQRPLLALPALLGCDRGLAHRQHAPALGGVGRREHHHWLPVQPPLLHDGARVEALGLEEPALGEAALRGPLHAGAHRDGGGGKLGREERGRGGEGGGHAAALDGVLDRVEGEEERRGVGDEDGEGDEELGLQDVRQPLGLEHPHRALPVVLAHH
eukprot:654989-Rhodomonas_salina.1